MLAQSSLSLTSEAGVAQLFCYMPLMLQMQVSEQSQGILLQSTTVRCNAPVSQSAAYLFLGLHLHGYQSLLQFQAPAAPMQISNVHLLVACR